jgi:hypothetical protein
MRNLEIYLGYEAFSRLVAHGERGSLRPRDSLSLDTAWTDGDWVQYEKDVCVAGHSASAGILFLPEF